MFILYEFSRCEQHEDGASVLRCGIIIVRRSIRSVYELRNGV